MDPLDQEKANALLRRGIEMNQISEFKRQFRDPKNSSKLREGLKIEEVFEKAGMEKVAWSDIPLKMQSFIMSTNKYEYGAPGVTASPGEPSLGQMIFGNKAENIYYAIQKSEEGFAWSRFWKKWGSETLRFEPINHNSSLSKIIDTVAFHEFGERLESKQGEKEAIEETREKTDKNLQS